MAVALFFTFGVAVWGATDRRASRRVRITWAVIAAWLLLIAILSVTLATVEPNAHRR